MLLVQRSLNLDGCDLDVRAVEPADRLAFDRVVTVAKQTFSDGRGTKGTCRQTKRISFFFFLFFFLLDDGKVERKTKERVEEMGFG